MAYHIQDGCAHTDEGHGSQCTKRMVVNHSVILEKTYESILSCKLCCVPLEEWNDVVLCKKIQMDKPIKKKKVALDLQQLRDLEKWRFTEMELHSP